MCVEGRFIGTADRDSTSSVSKDSGMNAHSSLKWQRVGKCRTQALTGHVSEPPYVRSTCRNPLHGVHGTNISSSSNQSAQKVDAESALIRGASYRIRVLYLFRFAAHPPHSRWTSSSLRPPWPQRMPRPVSQSRNLRVGRSCCIPSPPPKRSGGEGEDTQGIDCNLHVTPVNESSGQRRCRKYEMRGA